MSCYLKPKELNEVNEITSEIPFKNLLEEIIIFSHGIDRKGREALHDAYKMAGDDSIDFLLTKNMLQNCEK